MSIAKECDICGKLYKSYNVKQDKKNTNGLMFLNIDGRQKYYCGDVMDCCPECMVAIHTHIEFLKNGCEMKKPGEVTNGDIYEEFKRNYPDFVDDVEDWRPYHQPYTDEYKPMSIVLWMSNGERKRYSYITKKLYPEREGEKKDGEI